jgi:hypothetical protein
MVIGFNSQKIRLTKLGRIFFCWDGAPIAIRFPKSAIFTIFNPKTKMGVTIHYKGKLNSNDELDSFCEEMEDIAKSMGWKHTVIDKFDTNDKTPVKGIIIRPHEKSESLQLISDQLGNLRNVFAFEFAGEDSELTYMNFIKTQFAPVEIHIAVIKLLKYIQQKYISNLDVYDEGDYWQTGNEKILKGKIDFLNGAINYMSDVLNSIDFEEGSSAESIADKIEKVLKKMHFRKSK